MEESTVKVIEFHILMFRFTSLDFSSIEKFG